MVKLKHVLLLLPSKLRQTWVFSGYSLNLIPPLWFRQSRMEVGLLHPLRERNPVAHTSLYADNAAVFISPIKEDISFLQAEKLLSKKAS
jgi:hypothetical protein